MSLVRMTVIQMQHKFAKGLVLGVWRLLGHWFFFVHVVSGKTSIDFIWNGISHCENIHVVQ